MTTYTFPAQNLPLDASWDVIVVGGGPAGCTAAAAAAREGAKTLLIEATGSLGGMGTGGLVPAWCPFSDKEKIIYRGLAEKVFNATKAAMPHIDPAALDWVAIDPEALKRIYDDLVTQAGATVLFNTALAAVQKSGPRDVDVIIVANKEGLTAYRAKVYVDCTGDADVCAWAGAAFEQGDTEGELMPATHCFILTNVNEEERAKAGSLHSGNPSSLIYEILKSGKYPEIPDPHLCESKLGPGARGFNAGHLWKVDNTRAATVSQALMQGRKMAAAYQRALAEYMPESFGNSFLAATGSLMGIRETRRIIGDYVLTLDDYLARRSFDDEICRNSYYIDIHSAKKDAGKPHSEIEKRTHRYAKGESHGLPYRCLTPRDLDNVLVAGRSISCERSVQGSVRVMPVCLAMGEAAGMAAAYAMKHGNNVHQVNAQQLRSRLREMGGYLP